MGATQDIYNAMEALAKACGEKSTIQLCDNLFTLINCAYVMGTSLEKHLVTFWKNYTALLTSALSNPVFMTMTTGMAAALLL